MGDAVSGIDAARHRDGAAHELSLKGSGKALDGRQKVIYIRQRCRNLSTRDFPGLFIGQAVLDEGSADVDQKILFHLISCFLLVVFRLMQSPTQQPAPQLPFPNTQYRMILAQHRVASNARVYIPVQSCWEMPQTPERFQRNRLRSCGAEHQSIFGK